LFNSVGVKGNKENVLLLRVWLCFNSLI